MEKTQKKSKIELIRNTLLKSIYEGCWLEITYQNANDIVKTFWISIKMINFANKTLSCDSLSLDEDKNRVKTISIYLEKILSAKCLPNTCVMDRDDLIKYMDENAECVRELFPSFDYENVLSYLAACVNDDSSPVKIDTAVIEGIDLNVLEDNDYISLTVKQVKELKKSFIFKNNDEIANIELGVNLISFIHTNGTQIILAYKPVKWDIKKQRLRIIDSVLFCNKYKDEDGIEHNLLEKYIYEDERYLLDEYTKNYEFVKNLITSRLRDTSIEFNDTSKLILIKRIKFIDIETQFEGIREMYQTNSVTNPIKAFFGEFTVNRNRKYYPFCSTNNNLNPSQLVSIFSGLKDDLSFIQGPPGTGKTHTVLSLVTTAFFNGLTCLVTTNNNQPMKDLKSKFENIGNYKNETIELPLLRLSAKDQMTETIKHMNHLYMKYKDAKVNDKILEKNLNYQKENLDQIVKKLNEFEEYKTQKRREENFQKFIDDASYKNYTLDIISQTQKKVDDFDFSSLNDSIQLNEIVNKSFLYFNSAKYIQRLDKPKYQSLKDIILIDINDDEALKNSVDKFLAFLKEENGMEMLLDVFPIVISTNLSAAKLGSPKPHFDICIMDEAGQCNVATSLISIVRAKKTVLVGDIQQLQPVITLENSNNDYYKNLYDVDDVFDYKNNSIYSTMISNAPRCKETLLNEHYRCAFDIINFCNEKYYKKMLDIKSKKDEPDHLFVVDVPSDNHDLGKNVSEQEILKISKLLEKFKGQNKSIGIITPYVAQKRYLSEKLKKENLKGVDFTIGTIHTFQGNEKDIIIFSTTINQNTRVGTYRWLKNNKQLINVAVSRAKDEFYLLTNINKLEALHSKIKKNDEKEKDDIYDLYKYTSEKGKYEVIPNSISSQALDDDDFITFMDKEKLISYKLALSTISYDNSIFREKVNINIIIPDYQGKECFDFVIYNNKKPECVFQLIKATKKYEYNQKIQELCDKKGVIYVSIKPSETRSYFDIKESLKGLKLSKSRL